MDPRPPQLALRPSPLALRPSPLALKSFRLIVTTDGLTDGRMENLPILQDFVPYRGRCPASIKTTKPVAKRHQMVSGALALLYYFFLLFYY